MSMRPRALLAPCVALLLVALLLASCGAETEGTSTTGPPSTTTPTPSTGSTSTTVPISSTTPLLSLLAAIPEDPIAQSDGFIYFADYSAMESAYDAVRPADAQEFAGLSESDDAHKVWWVLFRGVSWIYSQYWQVSLETGPQTIGFSPLDVDQAVRYGVPPGDGLMLAGSFDAGAIGAAYQANVGLAPTDFDGITVWCAGEDPEVGFQVDVSNRMLENPFGGELGRRQPMIVSDGLLMSSADLGAVSAHGGAAAGTVPNLADAPGYRAAVEAVGEDAHILQATVAGLAAALNIAHPPLGDVPLSPETPSTTSETLPSGDQELPVFELLVLGDVVTDEEQIARLGLVYRYAGSAELAGAILLERLATYPSLSGSPFAEMLRPPNGTDARYYVREGSDRAVLVLEFPAPRATTEELVALMDAVGDEEIVAPPGWVYRRLSEMFLRRDTGWLSFAT